MEESRRVLAHFAASTRSVGGTLSRTSRMMLTSEVGDRKTSCVSGIWRKSLEVCLFILFVVPVHYGYIRCVDKSSRESGRDCAAEEIAFGRHGSVWRRLVK